MTHSGISAFALGLAAIAISGSCQAQVRDIGRIEYEQSCAVCHGKKGEGDGPFGAYVNTTIANLTTLTKRNNGVFPSQRVYESIDGRQVLKGHGERDMPIWGRRYMPSDREYNYADPDFNNPEAMVRARILALTEYVYRMQAK